MSNIPAVSGVVPFPLVESELGLGEGDEHCEFGDEYEEMPQGVLSLFQQLIPQELPIVGPRSSLSGREALQPVPVAAALSGKRHAAVGSEPALRLQEGSQPARGTERLESKERIEPRSVSLSTEAITRDLSVAMQVPLARQLEATPVVERVVSEQRPTLSAGPETRIAGGELRRASASERVDKVPQSQVNLANPVPTNTPTILTVTPLPLVESELGLGEGNEHFEFDEYEQTPQGVLSVLQQVMPRELPIIGPRPSLSVRDSLQPYPVAVALSGKRHAAVGSGPASRLQEGSQPARRTERLESRARIEPRGVSLSTEAIARDLSVAMQGPLARQLEATPVVERVVSEQRPTLSAGPETRIAGGEQRRAAPGERVDKTAQSQVILANPVPGRVALHDLAPGTEKAVSLHTRVPLPAPNLADKAVEAYLRLPFAKDGTVGFVNVSRPAGDLPTQLNLTASNSDISRHLAQHLDSAEPTWRLADSHDSSEQQGRGSNGQTDDDPDEPVAPAKHQDKNR